MPSASELEDQDLATPVTESFMNHLELFNDALRQQITAKIKATDEKHVARPAVLSSDYPLQRLQLEIGEVLRREFADMEIHPQIVFIDRQQFGGDLTIKIPELLKGGGPKNYIERYLPRILACLASSSLLAAASVQIEQKGMYVNLKLSDSFLFGTMSSIFSLGDRFGQNNSEQGQKILVDYSSPNAAKQLHAGHIRSTIIGHVISNLHQASGATVYRVNHINDIGGFGFLLEGYRRWQSTFAPDLSGNEQLLELYAIRRTLEKCREHKGALESLSHEQLSTVTKCFGSLQSFEDFTREYANYVKESDAAFSRLENGEQEETAMWLKMVSWSMDDFQSFYNTLRIHLDFVIGESFYLAPANHLVEKMIAAGQALVFSQEHVKKEKLKVNQQLEDGKIESQEAKSLIESIERDAGAVVVQLKNSERLVIRRSDGRSIYSTRDLAAIAVRSELFDPSQIVYVVGQEQRDHFSKVFETARDVGLCTNIAALKHIYFGFYVDAITKHKLSSREGASNVHLLFSESVKYFLSRINPDDSKLIEADRIEIAKKLAIASIVFNDLRKDKSGTVEINAKNLQETIQGFEKVGGAYLVYTVCRAKGILRKIVQELPSLDEVTDLALSTGEVSLLLKLQQIPQLVASAAQLNDPSVLFRHLFDLCNEYNSYYSAFEVISDHKVNKQRLLITAGVRQGLESALNMCHIYCPDRM